ncbi:MAG: 4Fe-4S dicluster domain-containing protein [bacterium]|nr:4Fe-4S dicluster domain-containing protein [bacterium]
MNKATTSSNRHYILQSGDFQRLLDSIIGNGYRCLGPTVQDQAIVLDDVSSVKDLPVGWSDNQQAAAYRLQKNGSPAFFGYVLGPGSWKKFLYPARERLLTTTRSRSGWKAEASAEPVQKMAFLGIRPCELQALAVLDKVLLEGTYADPVYRARRSQILVIAVNCAEVGGTCFCDSMSTGPKAVSGFDLALTEIITDGKHHFVVESATAKGDEIVKLAHGVSASDQEISKADAVSTAAAKKLSKKLNTIGVKDLLARNLTHPRWKETAGRCLTCSNCTLVCPTCFCITVEDYTDLKGNSAERVRRWDSCFTMDHSYIHGGSIRNTPDSRYRQWLTHKFSSWWEQYGISGCVGCGRCITWCPAAIDVTEEIQAIRDSEKT